MKKVSFRVSISLFVGLVFCNPAFSSVVLSSGKIQIKEPELINAITGIIPSLMSTIIMPSENIVLSEGSQIAPAYSSIDLSSGHIDINRGGNIAINADTSLNDMEQSVMDNSITLSGGILALSGASQIESELVNVSVSGNLYLDFSVFSSQPGLSTTGSISFISTEQISIYSFDNTPIIEDLINLTMYNEMPVDFNNDESVLFFSSQPIINGIFEANNIYIGNYSELSASAVPLPAAFWFFGSGLFGLVGLREVIVKKKLLLMDFV